jgi:hypothetical protein
MCGSAITAYKIYGRANCESDSLFIFLGVYTWRMEIYSSHELLQVGGSMGNAST